MRIIVTGGCGLIGSELIKELSLSNHIIIVLDLIKLESNYDNVKYIKFDITKDAYNDILIGADIIVHLAAEMNDEKKMFVTNVDATKRLLEESKKAKIKRIIYTSSVAIYGTINKKIINENESFKKNIKYLNTKNLLTYSISKNDSELEIFKYITNNNDIKIIIFRPSNVVDEKKLQNYFMWNFFTKILRGNRYTHHIYVKDVALTLVFAIDKFENLINNNNIEIYNLTDDDKKIKYKNYYLKIEKKDYLAYILSLPNFISIIKDIIKYRSFDIVNSIQSGSVIYSSKKLLNKMNFKYGIDFLINICKNDK